MQTSGRCLAALLIALSAALSGCASQSATPRSHPRPAPPARAAASLRPAFAGSLQAMDPIVISGTLVQYPLLTDVQMVGPYGGWAIEQLLHGTAIARTTDAGRHWTTLYVTPNPAVELSASSMQTAYALLSVCKHQTCTSTQVVATKNGGATWQSVYSAQGFAGKSISFVSPSVGYVGGTVRAAGGTRFGDLLATADGGQTWTQYPMPCGTQIFALSFPTPLDGFLLCGGQAGSGMQAKSLYRTTDGGVHWALVASVLLPAPAGAAAPGGALPLSGTVRSLFFLSTLDGWMGLDRGGIYATTDGGATWHPVWQPPFAPGADNAFSVGFSDPLHGWLLYGEGPPLATTEDGGRTWTIVYPPLSPATALTFLSPLDGVGAGWAYDGTLILTTSNGGQSWQMSGRAPVQISDLAVVGPRTYLVLGQNTLYRSEDGGLTWAAAAAPPGYYPAALGMLNADTGYLVAYKPGAGRTLFATVDGGETWQAVPAPFSPVAVAVSSGGGVMAVGTATEREVFVHGFGGDMQAISLSPGTPYLWLQRGGAWCPVAIPHWSQGQALPLGLRSGPGGLLWMWSPTHLWLSTNQGATWEPMAFGDQLAISDVSFSDAQHGWILAGSSVYATSDGGQTWREISGSPTY